MEQTIINYIKTEFHGGQPDLKISAQDDLLVSGLVESMNMIRLIQFVENQFEIRVDPQDMTIDNFFNVEAMVNYINQRKAAQ